MLSVLKFCPLGISKHQFKTIKLKDHDEEKTPKAGFIADWYRCPVDYLHVSTTDFPKREEEKRS